MGLWLGTDGARAWAVTAPMGHAQCPPPPSVHIPLCARRQHPGTRSGLYTAGRQRTLRRGASARRATHPIRVV